jgi:hypothetical protein
MFRESRSRTGVVAGVAGIQRRRKVASLLVLLVAVAALVHGGAVSARSSFGTLVADAAAVRINVGGGAYTASDGSVFSADAYYSGGDTASTTAAIAGTADPALYRDERWGNFSYSIPVANGSYDVRLHFVELYYGGDCVGKRVFSLDVVETPGPPDVSTLDICAGVGPDAALVETVSGVSVTGGRLDLQALYGSADDPELTAIEVVPVEPPPPLDVQAPSTPAGLVVSGQTQSSLLLSWSASIDGVGVGGYGVYRDGVSVAATTETSYAFTGLACGTSYTLGVDAVDAAGNRSANATVTGSTAACPPPPSGPCGTASTPPATYDHVIWIFMENQDYNHVIGSSSAPYENQLANACGLATNYSAITHPSLPNYIAATSGDYWGIQDDNPPASHPLTVPSIYSQVNAAGKTWRDYEESAPGNCPQSAAYPYAVKHDPAPYFTGIATDCANWDVPLGTTASGALQHDLAADTLPAFAFVTPNLCNDTHDCSVATGDAWLESWVPMITSSAAYRAGRTALVITWDEADGSASNQVATIVVSPSTTPGTRSDTAFSHYSLLKTTEQLLGFGSYLAHAGDPGTTSMRAAFHF